GSTSVRAQFGKKRLDLLTTAEPDGNIRYWQTGTYQRIGFPGAAAGGPPGAVTVSIKPTSMEIPTVRRDCCAPRNPPEKLNAPPACALKAF
ncbi:hypothetical protein EVAR_69800_1, partial [Eumeta japonica]